MSKLWLLLWCCECEKTCRLTAVAFILLPVLCAEGVCNMLCRDISCLVLGDRWASLQLPLDASLVSAAPYE